MIKHNCLITSFFISSLLSFVFLFAPFAQAEKIPSELESWDSFYRQMEKQKITDHTQGLSYIISGSLALLGGGFGEGLASDPLEKGVYTLFQTIGIASIGYGAYTWQIGNEDRNFYEMIQTSNISLQTKSEMLRVYRISTQERQKKERYIKMITHGLISALNFYSASQQSNDSIKTSLYFIGGVNLLACITFSF